MKKKKLMAIALASLMATSSINIPVFAEGTPSPTTGASAENDGEEQGENNLEGNENNPQGNPPTPLGSFYPNGSEVTLFGAEPLAVVMETQPAYDWYTNPDILGVYEINSLADYLGFVKITQKKAPADVTVTSETFLGETVNLNCDIDFSGMDFYKKESDGTVVSDWCAHTFRGIFNGNDHTIKNVTYTNEHSSELIYLGIFRYLKGGTTEKQNGEYISIGGTIHNLNVEGITVNSASRIEFGGLTAETVKATYDHDGGESSIADTTIKNCKISDIEITITDTSDYRSYVGGLIGYTDIALIIDNCSVENFTVTADRINYLGGLIGFFYISTDTTERGTPCQKGSLTNCTVDNFTATVQHLGGHGGGASGNFGGIGGMLGYGHYGKDSYAFPIEDCTVTNLDLTVNGGEDDSFVGGFLGMSRRRYNAKNCSVSGSIKASSKEGATQFYVGGFAGAPTGADTGAMSNWPASEPAITFTNCSADVDIDAKGTTVAGGFVGISGSSFADSNITINERLNTSYNSCTASGTISSEGTAGGFAGIADRGKFDECDAKNTTVNGTSSDATVGGFIGKVQSETSSVTKTGKLDINLDEVKTSDGMGLIGATNDKNIVVSTKLKVAKVGDTEYDTLQAAIDAAPAGGTVTLINDIIFDPNAVQSHADYSITTSNSFGAIAFISKDITIDLNGKTICYNNEKVTTLPHKYVFFLYKTSDATTGPIVTIRGNGKVDASYTNVDSTTANTHTFAIRLQPNTGATLTIENGTFITNTPNSKSDSNLIYIFGNGGVVNIKGGFYQFNDSYGEDNTRQTLNVKGQSMGDGNRFNITGGTLVGVDPRYMDDGNGVVDGYAVSKTDGNLYTVIPQSSVVATVTETISETEQRVYSYTTLADAVENASDGSTVKLLSDYTGRGFTVSNNIELFLDGKVYTINKAASGSDGIVVKNKPLTIVGGIIKPASSSVCDNLINATQELTLQSVFLDAMLGEDGYVINTSNKVIAQERTAITGVINSTGDNTFEYKSQGNADKSFNIGINECIFENYNYTFKVIHTLTFELDGGEMDIEKVKYYGDIDLSEYTPSRSRYRFRGWIDENGDSVETVTLDADKTVTATWKKKATTNDDISSKVFTVEFDSNGGSDVSNQKVTMKDSAYKPQTPTKDGFEFGGWYTDKDLTEKYDFSDDVTSDLTLYAKWIEIEEELPEELPEENWENPFLDVNENDWFFESVKFMNSNGLMSGMSTNQFAPHTLLDRGMFVTILYRLAGEPETENGISFVDVSSDAYYAKAAAWAQKNGIVAGINQNEFAPSLPITREQIAVILYRFALSNGYDVTQGGMAVREFGDYDDISDYALRAMTWAVNIGLMQGKTATTLNPKDNASRAEVAAMLFRFIEMYK